MMIEWQGYKVSLNAMLQLNGRVTSRLSINQLIVLSLFMFAYKYIMHFSNASVTGEIMQQQSTNRHFTSSKLCSKTLLLPLRALLKKMRWVPLLTLLVISTVGSPLTYAADHKVGKITLALGQAVVERSDGKKQEASSGMELYSGDTLVTFTSGYLHLQFIDNALLSMRPGSRLSIEMYDYDPESPEFNAVRFNLEEGLARSVSGSAAKQNNQKFRLNTPIAAIGVRGTDFTVLADADRVRTFVSEGAIVVSPFSSECHSLALGPCAKDGIELKGNSNQLVEFNSFSVRPQLLQLALETTPTSNLLLNDELLAKLTPSSGSLPLASSQIRVAAQSSEKQDDSNPSQSQTDSSKNTAKNNVADSTGSAQTNTENGTSATQTNEQSQSGDIIVANSAGASNTEVSNTGISSTGASSNTVASGDTSINITSSATEPSSLEQSSTVTILADANDQHADQFGGAEEVDVNEFMPKDIPKQQDMLWSYTPSDKFSAPAFIYSDQLVTAGINNKTIDKSLIVATDRFSLYRPNELFETINPERGNISFTLQDAAAFYYAGGKQFDLNVDSSMLQIDFGKGKFSTALQLSHEETGQISFSTSGEVLSNGLFNSQQPDQMLEGASSLDAKAAGYYFQQNIPHLESTIDGITVWQAPKK